MSERPFVVPRDWSKVAASRARTRWTGGAAVRDEDLLAVDEEAAALLGDAGDDAAQVGAGLRLGQVHAALELAGDEARQVPRA